MEVGKHAGGTQVLRSNVLSKSSAQETFRTVLTNRIPKLKGFLVTYLGLMQPIMLDRSNLPLYLTHLEECQEHISIMLKK